MMLWDPYKQQLSHLNSSCQILSYCSGLLNTSTKHTGQRPPLQKSLLTQAMHSPFLPQISHSRIVPGMVAKDGPAAV
jgi:hypothetical protein